MVLEAQTPASYDLSQYLAAYQPPTHPLLLSLVVSQIPDLRSAAYEDIFSIVINLRNKNYFPATQEFYTAMHIKTPLDNALYLSSFWSDLRM